MADDTDALELIAADHRKVEDLFSRFERSSDPQERTEIVHEVVHELVVHGEVEELVFYPRLRQAVPDGSDLADEALHEHVEMKETLNDLDGMTADDDAFDERMRELMDEVRHHVEEEESDIFPKVRQAISEDDLRDMGDRMQRAKAMVPTRPHPNAPTGPVGKLAAGAPVAIVDRVRDALRNAADEN
ncbi:MAG TPA: hemerythrin domain-containing protein, partial [Egibacteraceae bacterium]|nr:hemerythrin domain-containing protein [Egibacteraceae bacterium]